MITKLSHTSLCVLDQDKAYDFYVNKLGFKVHTDATMDNGFRWLTVTAPDAPDHEIVLFPATSEKSGFEKDVRDAMKLLLDKGVMGAGVVGGTEYTVGPGDLVFVFRNTAHFFDPTTSKFGYLLVDLPQSEPFWPKSIIPNGAGPY